MAEDRFRTQAATASLSQMGMTYDFLDHGGSQATNGFQGLHDDGIDQGLVPGGPAWEDALVHAEAQATGLSQVPATDDVAQRLSTLAFDEASEDGRGTPLADEPRSGDACAYCGIHDPATLVKCVKSGKWFCNGRVVGSASCIITHLVKSKLRECQLNSKSPVGDTPLECYACGQRNVFNLGFVPVKEQKAVVLLCRDLHAGNAALRDVDLDLPMWQALVEDRAFRSWLVKIPTDQEIRRARHLKLADVAALEDAWKVDPAAKLEDLGQQGPGEDAPPIALTYEDAYAYQNVMSRLVKLEADNDKAAKEAQARTNVSIQWARGLNKKHQAYLLFPREDADLRLMTGDELRLRHSCAGPENRRWEATGVVVRLEDTSEAVVVELRDKKAPTGTTVGYTVEFVWKSTSFDRMQTAMKSFVTENTACSSYLFESLLGHRPPPKELSARLPQNISAPNLPQLNPSQASAVRGALGAPLSLVQGPPGTGKTVTAATIVYHLARQELRSQGANRKRNSQVLVAAPSNVAVDQLAEKVEATGLRVVRLSAKAREAIASPVQHLTLHYQVANADPAEWKELRALLQLREEAGELAQTEDRRLMQLRRSAERSILLSADVICCTCVGAGDPRLSGMRFHRVLLDESTQATEAESLIPIVMGAKQVILIGDHCQLGPVIMSKQASKAGLGLSMFERLVLLGVKPSRLAVQYRMHPALSRFPSDTFYEGALQNGVTAAQRILHGFEFPWPAADRPMMFYSQTGIEEISPSGTSYLNRTEASAVEKIVTYFLRKGATPQQIGVVTPYEGQRVQITATLLLGPGSRGQYANVEVSSVDAFQGREKDFIILSCVRSNEHQGIGFLSDPRRLNVALTRAKYGIIVIGNPKVLSKQDLWNRLLVHYKEGQTLVEGPLTNLKPCLIQLAKPKKVFDSQRFALGGAGSARFVPAPSASGRDGGTGEAASAPAPAPRTDAAFLNGHMLPPSQPLYAITQAEIYATQASLAHAGAANGLANMHGQHDYGATQGAGMLTQHGMTGQLDLLTQAGGLYTQGYVGFGDASQGGYGAQGPYTQNFGTASQQAGFATQSYAAASQQPAFATQNFGTASQQPAFATQSGFPGSVGGTQDYLPSGSNGAPR